MVGLERDLYELFTEGDSDAPHDVELTPVPVATWRRCILGDPSLDYAGTVVALDGDRAVSSCWMVVDPQGSTAAHQFTTTARDYRRRGLARLLKLTVLDWAADAGIRSIGTSNDLTNEGMISLNRQLGYERVADAFAYQLSIG